jgi:superoxide dismutase
VPDLPYAYEALEPHIDAATMKFHHDKHHLAYVTNANKAVAGKEAGPILDQQKGAIKVCILKIYYTPAISELYDALLRWTSLLLRHEHNAELS